MNVPIHSPCGPFSPTSLTAKSEPFSKATHSRGINQSRWSFTSEPRDPESLWANESLWHKLPRFWKWCPSVRGFPVYACSVTLVMSDSLQPHGLWFTRLLCPQASPGENTRVGCHILLQGIFLTQGTNLCLLHWQARLYHLATGEAHLRV